MQNSIFDIFGNERSIPTITLNASTPMHGGAAIIRGPAKPGESGLAPKKVLGDNVLYNVGNRNNSLQTSTSKGGIKNVPLQKDQQCKPGTSFGLQKCLPKKVTLGDKESDTSKLVLLKDEVNIQTEASSQLKPSGSKQEASSCGFESVIPKHLRLTSEEIGMLVDIFSFRMKPEEFVMPESVPIEDPIADLEPYDPYEDAPPFIEWNDPSDLPLPESE